jgi:hypothetical protein
VENAVSGLRILKIGGFARLEPVTRNWRRDGFGFLPRTANLFANLLRTFSQTFCKPFANFLQICCKYLSA